MTRPYLNLVNEGQQLMLDLEPPAEPICDFQRAAAMRVLVMLDNIGWPYLVINDKGEKIGTLDYVPRPSAAPAPIPSPGKTPRKGVYPRGEPRVYWMPIVERANLQLGQKVRVPFDPRWSNKKLAGHISSWASNEKSRVGINYATSRDDKNGCVIVMRLP